MKRQRIGMIAVVVVCCLGARPSPAATEEAYASVALDGIPHVQQKPDFCGEACAEMMLRRLDREMDQDDVFGLSGLDPVKGRGCHTAELANSLRSIGFRVGDVWFRVKPGKQAAADIWKQLHLDLLRGVPSIVCMHYDDRPDTTEHFRLIIGYDQSKDEVIYHEPALANGAHLRMALQTFLDLWPLKYSKKEWTVIRLRLEPGRLIDAPEGDEGTRFSKADYAQHIMRLKQRLPHEKFTIVLEEPFVVIGDESPEMVERRAEGTVRWATEHLKKAYFSQDPLQILDVWLFRGKDSYENHAELLFGDKPSTKFGYYSSRDRALVMNIATGGGTLVHEIVHPFVEANFPACPSWFNEGLGSLYEQSASRRDQIVGLTNWRLAGLQKAIVDEDLPTFDELCSMNAREFYGGSKGDNYAQARYLLYYLQEKSLLRNYYRAFHAARATDPTGYETLKSVLDEDDMEAFQKRWESWVLNLTFP